jgi:hypothetical protein
VVADLAEAAVVVVMPSAAVDMAVADGDNDPLADRNALGPFSRTWLKGLCCFRA